MEECRMEYDEYNNILVDYSGLICFIYDVKTTEIVYMTKACMELLKITKEFWLKFNTLSIALSTLSPTETNGKI